MTETPQNRTPPSDITTPMGQQDQPDVTPVDHRTLEEAEEAAITARSGTETSYGDVTDRVQPGERLR